MLPLLGAGHIHTVKSRYQQNVRKGVDWLVEHQNPAGDLFIGGDRMSYLYSHAIATMALCEAYGVSKDEKLRLPAEKAIAFIADAQNTMTGGWRCAPVRPGDTSVFGWQMFALRSARLAKLEIPKNVFKGCRVYLDSAAADPQQGHLLLLARRRSQGDHDRRGPPLPAVSGLAPRLPRPRQGRRAHVAADLRENQERNIYYWYYATQMLHNMQNADWERWNPMVREGLIAMQVHGEGCDRGSWDPVQPRPRPLGHPRGPPLPHRDVHHDAGSLLPVSPPLPAPPTPNSPAKPSAPPPGSCPDPPPIRRKAGHEGKRRGVLTINHRRRDCAVTKKVRHRPTKGPCPTSLDQEQAVYDANLSRWLPEHEGEFVLIKGDTVDGFYESRDEALTAGYARFGIGPLLVKRVSPFEPIANIPNALF